MLKVSALTKSFQGSKEAGRVMAADSVEFSVDSGNFFTLLGPSGCGKTTTLRCVAGLERPDAGEIVVGERKVYSSSGRVFVQPNDRQIGMVFQSYAIWPHMNVFDNVAFPLRVGGRKVPKQEIKERVARILDVVQLGDLADRPATKLSGGQQQRLALARALVIEPSLLLLDEPLSNLDAKLRESLRFELKRLQRERGITTIYVTHDQGEALALSDVIAVMRSGKIVQMGKPQDIYECPETEFVADFIGSTNFIPGVFRGAATSTDGADEWLVETPQGVLRAHKAGRLKIGEQCAVGIRPENVEMLVEVPVTADAKQNIWQGEIQTRLFSGEAMDYQVRIGDLEIRCRTHATMMVPTGEKVALRLSPEHCTALPIDA